MPKPSSAARLKKAKEENRKLHERSTKDSDAALSAYSPLILESASKKAVSLQLPPCTASSSRIPGALVIDPRVRKIADAAGMKFSENAIWLLVVALKEYTKTVLDDTLSTIKAVETGSVPRRSSIRPQLLPKKRTAADTKVSSSPAAKKSANGPAPTKSITPLDIHSTVASMPGGSRSLGCCLSRATFERSLFSSFDKNSVIRGSTFNEVKKFVVSAVTPPIETQSNKVEASSKQAEAPKPNKVKEEMPKSPGSRGLGKGAKDLASLKARSSFSETASTSSSISTVKASGAADFSTRPAAQSGAAQNPSTPPKEPEKAVDSASAPSQVLTTPRKGKGFGVKDLAAMRARSLTAQSEGAADTAKAAADATADDESKEAAAHSSSPDASSAVPPPPAAAAAAAAPSVQAPAPVPAQAAAPSEKNTHTAPPISSPQVAARNNPVTSPAGSRSVYGAPPSLVRNTSASSTSSQPFPQRHGIQHHVGAPFSQLHASGMQNPSVMLANAQLAQGLANALMQNAGQAPPPGQHGQRPTMAAFPGQAPQGLMLGQFAQMVPGMQQSHRFSQVSQVPPVGPQMQSTSAARPPTNPSFGSSAPTNNAQSAAETAQAMVFADPAKQNMASAAATIPTTTKINQGSASASAPSPARGNTATQSTPAPAATDAPPNVVAQPAPAPTSTTTTGTPNASVATSSPCAPDAPTEQQKNESESAEGKM